MGVCANAIAEPVEFKPYQSQYRTLDFLLAYFYKRVRVTQAKPFAPVGNLKETNAQFIGIYLVVGTYIFQVSADSIFTGVVVIIFGIGF